MKKVGVLPPSLSFALTSPINDELKQLFLLYDHLTFGDNVDFIEMLRRHLLHLRLEGQLTIKQRINEYIFLIEKNILIDAPVNRSQIEYTTAQKNANDELQEFAGYRGDIKSDLGLFIEDYDARLRSTFINQQYSEFRAFPVTSPYSFVHRNQEMVTSPAEVLSIACFQFPAITKNAGWEQILEFKNDADSYLKYQKLLNWATAVSKGGYSVAEIKDYIEYVTAEYIEALRLHNLKYELSAFQTYFNFIAEIVENLLKLKLSDLVKMPVEIRKQKIEMLEEEKQLPGNEIAYFIKAQIDFTNKL